MVRLLAVLVLAGTSVNAQIWVESYTYSGSSLDSQKWTLSSSSGIVQYTFLNPGLTLSGGGWSLVDWYYRLPTNLDWSVVQRFKGSSSGSVWKNAYVAANDGFNDIVITYEHQTIAGNANPTWFSANGGDETFITENWNYHWFGLVYNSTSRTLSRVFSLDSDQNIPLEDSFTKISDVNINASSNEIKITTGVLFQSGSSEFTFTDFQIVPYSVPEPSSISLLLAGGAVFAAARRRRLV